MKKILMVAMCVLVLTISVSAKQNVVNIQPKGPAYNDMEIRIECPVNSDYGLVTKGSFTTTSPIVRKEYYRDYEIDHFFVGVRYYLEDGTTYVPSTEGYWGGYEEFYKTPACKVA